MGSAEQESMMQILQNVLHARFCACNKRDIYTRIICEGSTRSVARNLNLKSTDPLRSQNMCKCAISDRVVMDTFAGQHPLITCMWGSDGAGS